MLRRSESRPPPIARRRRPLAGQLGVDALVGGAAALGQAPWELWPLTLAAMGTVIWRISRAGQPATAAWHAMAAGFGYFTIALFWIIQPFLVEPDRYGWMAPFALILMGLGGALFWAIPTWVAARIAAPDWRAQAVAFAAALFLSDWIRGWIFTGFPWALIGHVWAGTPVAQSAAFVGALGLSAITLTAAAVPVLLWRPAPSRIVGAAPGLILSALFVSVMWAGGLVRLDRPLPPSDGPLLRLVQPDADQALKWDPVWAQEFWNRLLSESAAPAPRRPDAVIWPETAVSFLLDQGDIALPLAVGTARAPIITGIQRADGGRYYNSLVEIGADGRQGAIYDKFHLVPFGEYIPWGDAMARIGIHAFAAQEGFGYTPGPGPRVLRLAGLPPVQPLICYEAIFPQHLRGIDRPAWLLQITNDAWFGTLSGPYQHLAQARLRAIETGLPMMRVANTGITAAIDPVGRITAQLGLGKQGHIDAVLPAALAPTLWLRLGPAPLVALALALIAGAGWMRRRR